MRLCVALVAALLAGSLPLSAGATPPEDAYIAARDKYLKHFEKDDPASSDAARKDEDRAIADLEKQLKAIIGPVKLKGIDAAPRNQVDTLSSSNDTFGHLDALAYGGPDAKFRTFVTTEGLLKNWLRVHETWWGEKNAKMSQAPGAALKTADFYTQAIGQGSAFILYAELPITRPPSASFAIAWLYMTAQDFGPWEPDKVLVSVIQGGRLFIVGAPANTKAPVMAACSAIWKAAEKKSAENIEKSGHFSEDFREKGDKDFHRCFAERAKSEPFYAKLTAQAQAIAADLPAK
jgi:hypothetical protein